MALTKKAERTKAKLLDSAQRLISAHGFDNVSVEDITKDSGVAKGTFYHYFECKEDVVRELSRKTAMATIERAIAHEGDVIERCCFYFGEIYKDCSGAASVSSVSGSVTAWKTSTHTPSRIQKPSTTSISPSRRSSPPIRAKAKGSYAAMSPRPSSAASWSVTSSASSPSGAC